MGYSNIQVLMNFELMVSSTDRLAAGGTRQQLSNVIFVDLWEPAAHLRMEVLMNNNNCGVIGGGWSI